MLALFLLITLLVLMWLAAIVASFIEPEQKPPKSEEREKDYSDAA